MSRRYELTDQESTDYILGLSTLSVRKSYDIFELQMSQFDVMIDSTRDYIENIK